MWNTCQKKIKMIEIKSTERNGELEKNHEGCKE